MSRNKPARRSAITLLACGLVVSFGASPAQAQSPARGGYDGTNVISTLPELGGRGTGTAPATRGVQRESGAGGGVLGAFDSGSPAAAMPRESGDAPGSGSLPFTGFEGGLVALMGLALLATGLALRRAGSARR